jgi:hypothetical protein
MLDILDNQELFFANLSIKRNRDSIKNKSTQDGNLFWNKGKTKQRERERILLTSID